MTIRSRGTAAVLGGLLSLALVGCGPILGPPDVGGDPVGDPGGGVEQPLDTAVTGTVFDVALRAEYADGACPIDENNVVTLTIRNTGNQPRRLDAVELVGTPTRWKQIVLVDAAGVAIRAPYVLGRAGSPTDHVTYHLVRESMPVDITVAFRDPEIRLHSGGIVQQVVMPMLQYAMQTPRLRVYDATVEIGPQGGAAPFHMSLVNETSRDIVVTGMQTPMYVRDPGVSLRLDGVTFPFTVPANGSVDLRGTAHAHDQPSTPSAWVETFSVQTTDGVSDAQGRVFFCRP